MDEFFSKYGWLIIAALIIIVALVLVTPVGQAIRTNILRIISDFNSQVVIPSFPVPSV